ncbi:sensor histidine kinase [Alteromonas oceanisediminis]|uniref:sensor histidine kinase n=1 Tax=Alteromonas oceanisediminis TaxID=2836180 RepID=UPI001BD9E745|nr:HAMP domain-containing sensor histidine kinase [Alteromonas oceanisediminis]MBT0587164.1 HAMP domain-containing histidine kinase [Alteromonas oceanisediminis]
MPTPIDFSLVLAAAVHDMKNSLSLLMQSLETLETNIDEHNSTARQQLSDVHYEAARLNTGLVQMLSLYRSELSELPLNIDEHFIEDVFTELAGANAIYIRQRNVTLNLHYENDISGFFDKDLIFLLLNDVLINAMRYGNQTIDLSASMVDNQLVITIEDDGQGYPQRMLEQSTTGLADFNVSQGRTGLGLFFARLIAKAHSNHDQHGKIELSNGGKYGGSVFKVKLP